VKFTGAVPLVLPDKQQELARRNHEQRITEVQVAVDDLSRAAGRLLGPPVILTGFGQYTPNPAAKTVRVRMIGGGGAGGGTVGAVGLGGGGGGTSGWYLDFVVPCGTGGTFVCGAGGTGAAGANGNPGGNTTLVLNGFTYVAAGGAGGLFGTLGAGGVAGPGGLTAGSTDVSGFGFSTASPGDQAEWAGVFVLSGDGGASPFGPPGVAVSSGGPGITPGNPGVRGSGGSGSVGNGAGPSTGAAGGAGMIIIEEYS